MQSCTQMQRTLETLAREHGVDLNQVGAELVLELPRKERLCVTRRDLNQIAITQSFALSADQSAAPELVCFVDSVGTWLPIKLTVSLMAWETCAELVPDARAIASYNAQRQAALTAMVEQWAQELWVAPLAVWAVRVTVERG